MLGKLSGWDDTIVALATPQGVGAIGIVRVSGKDAISIVDVLFPSKNLTEQPSHTLHVGLLKDGSSTIDQVVISLYKSPASYTGEDTVEISAHGSPYILEKTIKAITAKGARLAKPGEFTQRAFLNGKLDLTQAEAVADLIQSNTEASRKHALQNIRGGFSNVLKQLRDKLLTFSALIELELDFSQEDVEFADRTQLNNLVTEAQTVTANLLSSFALGNVIKNGVSVAIIGKPNAGKSTLLNTLLNENRAIVSEIAGTTRDTIEETLNIGGILFRLIDTAGIRQHTADTIESIGVQRSLEKMQQADVVIYVAPPPPEGGILETEVFNDIIVEKGLVVINKSDTIEEQEKLRLQKLYQGSLFIAAKTGQGVEVLKARLVDMVIGEHLSTESTIVSNARHYEALRMVSESLSEVIDGLQTNLSGDLLALDIKRSLHYLGELTGEVTNEDQLDYIFSKFCIGK